MGGTAGTEKELSRCALLEWPGLEVLVARCGKSISQRARLMPQLMPLLCIEEEKGTLLSLGALRTGVPAARGSEGRRNGETGPGALDEPRQVQTVPTLH